MQSNKIEKYYRGYKIIGILLKNRYQGAIFDSLERIHVIDNCINLEETIKKLTSFIDESPILYNRHKTQEEKILFKNLNIYSYINKDNYITSASYDFSANAHFICKSSLSVKESTDKIKLSIQKHQSFSDFLDSNNLNYKGLKINLYYDDNKLMGCVLSGKKEIYSQISEDNYQILLDKLKEWIDNNEDEVKRSIGETHKIFLDKIGIEHSDVINISLKKNTNRIRHTHCWSCKHPIDNTTYYECDICSWIICFCGACGCGYKM
jgi:hypothetical protein|tara:strand:- start:522 stop:1313 length:792 start_codon:yes stop_codon:yes gene_type:complete